MYSFLLVKYDKSQKAMTYFALKRFLRLFILHLPISTMKKKTQKKSIADPLIRALTFNSLPKKPENCLDLSIMQVLQMARLGESRLNFLNLYQKDRKTLWKKKRKLSFPTFPPFLSVNPFPNDKLKQFADDNFKSDENGRSSPKGYKTRYVKEKLLV